MALSAIRASLAGFGAQPVAISSPHPPAECLRRIANLTSRRGHTWYLDSHTAGLPDPRFRGAVGPSWFSVARFSETLGRNSFVPWVAVQVQPNEEGGSALTGTVGLVRAVRVVMLVIAASGGLILLASLTTGMALLASGHLGKSIPFVLIPLAIGCLAVLVMIRGLRSLARDTSKVVHDVSDALDATTTRLDSLA